MTILRCHRITDIEFVVVWIVSGSPHCLPIQFQSNIWDTITTTNRLLYSIRMYHAKSYIQISRGQVMIQDRKRSAIGLLHRKIWVWVDSSAIHPHNHHLSLNSPRLMFLFVKCATVNKVYHILSFLMSSHVIISHLISSHLTSPHLISSHLIVSKAILSLYSISQQCCEICLYTIYLFIVSLILGWETPGATYIGAVDTGTYWLLYSPCPKD